MGDVGETFNAHKAASAVKRAENRENSTALLEACKVDFQAKNDGAHLIINHGGVMLDFWPGTGKWVNRATKKDGRGVFPLLRHIKVDPHAIQTADEPHYVVTWEIDLFSPTSPLEAVQMARALQLDPSNEANVFRVLNKRTGNTLLIDTDGNEYPDLSE